MQVFCGISNAGFPSREVLTLTRGVGSWLLESHSRDRLGENWKLAFHRKTPLLQGERVNERLWDVTPTVEDGAASLHPVSNPNEQFMAARVGGGEWLS